MSYSVAEPLGSIPDEQNAWDREAWASVVEPGETFFALGNSVGRLLCDRDYTIILGRASSQYAVPHLAEQWQAAQTAIYQLVGLCDALDSDGITLYTPKPEALIQPHFQCHEAVTSSTLQTILAGQTCPEAINLTLCLQTALAHYFRRKAEGRTKANGEVILALFDGEPLNRMGIVRAIVDATKHINHAGELGIGLLQIGDNSIAEGFFSLLDHDLQLAGAAFDIVKFWKVDSLNGDSLTEFLTEVIRH